MFISSAGSVMQYATTAVKDCSDGNANAAGVSTQLSECTMLDMSVA